MGRSENTDIIQAALNREMKIIRQKNKKNLDLLVERQPQNLQTLFLKEFLKWRERKFQYEREEERIDNEYEKIEDAR